MAHGSGKATADIRDRRMIFTMGGLREPSWEKGYNGRHLPPYPPAVAATYLSRTTCDIGRCHATRDSRGGSLFLAGPR